MSQPTAVVVLCTAPDEDSAEELAAQALAAGLAACVTMLPGVTSWYHWEGKLEQASEVQLLLKTAPSHQQPLIDLLKAAHPYQTPELLVLPVLDGESEYLSWLSASLK